MLKTIIPSKLDVLFGRGYIIDGFEGNLRLREEIKKIGGIPGNNFMKAVDVVRKIRERGGRFLKRSGRATEGRNLVGPWQETKPEEAIKKVMTALENHGRKNRAQKVSTDTFPKHGQSEGTSIIKNEECPAILEGRIQQWRQVTDGYKSLVS